MESDRVTAHLEENGTPQSWLKHESYSPLLSLDGSSFSDDDNGSLSEESENEDSLFRSNSYRRRGPSQRSVGASRVCLLNMNEKLSIPSREWT